VVTYGHNNYSISLRTSQRASLVSILTNIGDPHVIKDIFFEGGGPGGGGRSIKIESGSQVKNSEKVKKIEFSN
jgi:hypothetical protein